MSVSKLTLPRKSVPFVDREGRVFAVAGGKPANTREWDRMSSRITHKIKVIREEVKFSPKQLLHRRGTYPTLRAGISHGGGQRVRTSFLGHFIYSLHLRRLKTSSLTARRRQN